MKKNYLIVLTVIVAVGLCIYNVTSKRDTSDIVQDITVTEYKSATYLIEGVPVKLIDGKAETDQASSSSKIITQYFGNEATGDVNGDGVPDTAFVLSQNTGGSGTFYYVTVALKQGGGYVGTNAVLLGDRIAPQTTEIKDGQVIVNYAERKLGEPMITRPSVGVSKYLKVIGSQLVEQK